MKTEKLHIEPDLFSYSSELDHETKVNEDKIENEELIYNLFHTTPLSTDARFFLKTEAYLLQLAYAYNKILSLSNSRTRILAHQVESTHIIVNALNQRFLIADEVGLGKTIEAGLVINELMYRYNYKRILIICPASLLFQWQNEMLSKFNNSFTIMDRKTLHKAKSLAGEDGNPWGVFDKIICSLDFIKNNSFADDLSITKWDAVIFDEAHRLRRDALHSTLAYSAAEIIAERTRALLLLSATPFRGKLEELFYLISLLDKNILGPFSTFYKEYCIDDSDLSLLRSKISQVVLRRTKREVGGFTRRFATTIKFELYPDERNLYNETTRYVVEEFNRALQTENRAVGFVMTVFQKLLDSSSYALHAALANRVGRLKEMLERAESNQLIMKDFIENVDTDFINETEDIDVIIDVSNDKTAAELKKEIKTINYLLKISEKIEINKKGEKLKELLKTLYKKGHKKFLIFTQFRTTQEYLKKILSEYSVEIFNGSMNREQKEQAISDFKDHAEILIATEAGGEGRNMQFCNIVINYDLPWSPLKVEQRIGRVHRFGQAKDVYIYNFSTKDTVAERVLEVLANKLKLFEESIGTPDVLLGQIEDELKLNNLFMDMVSGKKNRKDIDGEIDERIRIARMNYEKLSELTLADRMDFNYDEYYKITLKERQFSNQRIEGFVNSLQKIDGYSLRFIGEKNKKNNLYSIKCDENNIELKGRYGTFDSQKALENEGIEFLAFGHHIVDNFIQYCQSDDFGGTIGIRAIKYDKPFIGIVINYIVTFKTVSVSQELIPVVVGAEDFLYSYELDEIEKELTEQDYYDACIRDENKDKIDSLISESKKYFKMAKMRVLNKINSRIMDMSENLDIHIDPELEKIRDSYNKMIKELEEKLDVQESQMKWYGKDMKGVITRTKNKIMKAEREKEFLLQKYRGYLGVKYSIKMLNAGIVVSVGE